jgi:UDP-N-acetyl-D-mannosaminuronic acid transferase (WecB/TagA/CpsF family)
VVDVVGGHAVVHIRIIPFSVVNYDSVLDLFADWVVQRVPRQVCIANVHTLITALDNPAYLKMGHD